MRWVLRGRVERHYESEGWEDNVALFDSKEAAHAYLAAAWLKGKRHWDRNPFRKKSLLSMYDSAWVEEWEDEDLPVNPTLD